MVEARKKHLHDLGRELRRIHTYKGIVNVVMAAARQVCGKVKEVDVENLDSEGRWDDLIEQAVANQGCIGWIQLFQGFVDVCWGKRKRST